MTQTQFEALEKSSDLEMERVGIAIMAELYKRTF